MTNYGKYNLYAMLGLPVIAALGSIVMFGFLPGTIAYVVGTNLLPMLVGGLVSALLLRFATKPSGKGSHRDGTPAADDLDQIVPL